MNKKIKTQRIQKNAKISEQATIEGNVWIEQGSRVFKGASIRGPCYIGENTIIGSNSLVRDYSSLGQKCIVGFSTEIKHSIIGDQCLFHMNYIGDSIISNNCLFGAGTITANFRFDENNIKVVIGDKKIDSGNNKLGIIMGDNCKTGINACLQPGIKVGPQSIVGPNVNLQQNLEPKKIIFINKNSYNKKDLKIEATSENKKQILKKIFEK